jgi:hypothetical protein
MQKKILLASALAACACVAQGASPNPSQKSLKPAVEKYLKEKGDFCLGKFNWPVIVTELDRQGRTNDAIQMPVLENIGLVASSSAPNDPTAKSYELTDEGKKYYIVKKAVTLGPLDKPIDHPGDFCVAKLKLDHVVGWQPVEVVDGRPQTTVNYTYKVGSVAPWARDPRITKVFPMIDRIVGGEGKQHLMQRFAWADGWWVAVTPGG